MIGIVVPLRISFVGGGTDLPNFFNKFGGEVISVSIRKFIYIFLNELSDKKKILLKYSKTELVEKYNNINNPLFRETLKLYKIRGVDINSIADMPSRSGLGSSSAFCVALVALCEEYKNINKNNKINKKKIARIASNIEINKLNEPIGYQDHYSCSIGGLNHIKFEKKTISAKKIKLNRNFASKFQNSICLIFTGMVRSASKVLKKQSVSSNILKNNEKYIALKNEVKNFKKELKKKNIKELGAILYRSWKIKKEINSKVSNSKINLLEKKISKCNPYGYKLLGAGNGGYFCIIANKNSQKKLKKIFKEDFYNISFDNHGVRKINIIF